MLQLQRETKLTTVYGAGLGLVAGGVMAGLAHSLPHIAGFDWASWATQVISILLPSLTIVVTFYARQLITIIPSWLLPFAAMALGTAADWLVAFATTHQANTLLAAFASALGVLCYDAAKQWVGGE